MAHLPPDAVGEFTDSEQWRNLLHRMFHESPIGISLTAPDGTLTRINSALAAMLGYEREELQRKGFAEITHPDDVAAGRQFVRQALGGEVSGGRFVKRYLHREGHAVWADVSAVLLRDANGAPLHFVTHIVDISRTHSAEAKFGMVFEHAAAAVMVASPQGVYRDVNASACAMFRGTREQIIGLTFRDIVDAEDLQRLPLRVDELIATGRMRSVRRLRRLDGTVFDAEINAQLLPDGSLLGIVRDISEFVREQSVLRTRLRLAEAEATTTLNELLQIALEEAERLTGSCISFFHFVEPDQNTLLLQTWSKRTLLELCSADHSGEHYPVETAGVWADCVRERRLVVHNDYASLPHRKGLPTGHAPVVRELTVPISRGELLVAVMGVGNKPIDYTDADVTAVGELGNAVIDVVLRRRAEDELRRHRDHLDELVRERTAELARSNRELEQFAVVASHDLKEPLRKIRAFGDILATDYASGLPSEAQDYLGRMTAAACRLQRMIESLLAWSQVTTRARPFVAVALDAVASTVVSEFEPRIADLAATVQVGPLPVVQGDPQQLHQLLQNLIGNALKFARIGVPPVVRIGGSSDQAMAQVWVEDEGIGIAKEFRQRVFGMFQRLHAADLYEGSGIGLAICHKIAERHGGSIAAVDGAANGIRLIVTLPAAVEQPPADGSPPAKRGAFVGPRPRADRDQA